MENLTPRIVLPETALCAIVRDEVMNPAGGIVDFIDSTVPYVEEAVVVDALSTDGTREALEQLQQKYSHLRVFDHRFTNYAGQRNYALKQVTAKKALVLDADERLTGNDFVCLEKIMREQPAWGYEFSFLDIIPERTYGEEGRGHHLRLFKKSSRTKYKNVAFRASNEYLYLGKVFVKKGALEGISVLDSGIVIKHFRPTDAGRHAKRLLWYDQVVNRGKAAKVEPHTVDGFAQWKAYNPARENFR